MSQLCELSDLTMGKRFRHYKNGEIYVVEGVGQNPNTEELAVFYFLPFSTEGGSYWRPVEEFITKFEKVSE